MFRPDKADFKNLLGEEKEDDFQEKLREFDEFEQKAWKKMKIFWLICAVIICISAGFGFHVMTKILSHFGIQIF